MTQPQLLQLHPGGGTGGRTWQHPPQVKRASDTPTMFVDSVGASNVKAHLVAFDGWRAPVAKIAAILRAREGWDNQDSQPADRDAMANFASWFSTVRNDRQRDAEPMLTDEGRIRIEWNLGDYECTAEIGPDTMWLCQLAPDPSRDFDREVGFDAKVLSRFFYSGIISQ